jgi:hypothetical protein
MYGGSETDSPIHNKRTSRQWPNNGVFLLNKSHGVVKLKIKTSSEIYVFPCWFIIIIIIIIIIICVVAM